MRLLATQEANTAIEAVRELVYKPEIISAITQEDRQILMAALQRLSTESNESDLTLAQRIISNYAHAEVPQKSLINAIRNKWQNIFANRISSKKVELQLKTTGSELFLKQGLALLNIDRPKAIALFAEAYYLGHPQAAYHLGKVLEADLTAAEWKLIPKHDKFEERRRPPTNKTPAKNSLSLAFYKEAAKAGVKEAQYEIGLHYADRIPNHFPRKARGPHDLNPQEEKAVNWFKKAAAQGHIEAMFRCGQIYARSPSHWGFTEDLQRAAKKGHPQAQLTMGFFAMTYGEPDNILDPRFIGEAKNYLNQAIDNPKISDADKGDAYFLRGLIEYVYDVKEFNVSPSVGLESIQKAAELGCIEAQIFIARNTDDPEIKVHWIARLREQSPLDVHPERFGYTNFQSGLSKSIYRTILGTWLHELGLISASKSHELEHYGSERMYAGYPRLAKIELK